MNASPAAHEGGMRLTSPAQARRRLLARIDANSAAHRVLVALRRLRTRGWARERFIAELKAHDRKLYNDAYNHFRREAPALGMGRVQAAIYLAGIEVPAGMNRHTTLTQDLDALVARIDAGASLLEPDVCAFDSRLFNRVKKRAANFVGSEVGSTVRSSWKAVVYLLWKKRPDLDVIACFDHLPDGLYPDLPRLPGPRWFWSSCGTPQERRSLYVLLIREMITRGVAVESLRPDPFSKLSDGAVSFLRRVNNDAHRAKQAWNWGTLIEEASGLRYVADARGRQSGATHGARAHTLCRPRDLGRDPGMHRRLRSAEEATVDGVLALLVGRAEYEQCHAHDVPMTGLVGPGHLGEVDIVLCSVAGPKAALEVTNGVPDAGYITRRDTKLAALRSHGLHADWVDGELVGSAYEHELTRKLLPAIRAAGLQPRMEVGEALAHLATVPTSKLSYPAYAEAVRRARGACVQDSTDYKDHYARLGLPSNPNVYYKGAGWVNWSEFLGKPLKPGRRKGAKYSRGSR